MSTSPRIALVYDRVNTPYGGAEHVLEALHEIFPDAPLFTSVYDPGRARWAKDFEVIPSWVQRLPFARNFHRHYVGLMPLAFESFELDAFDVVISITSAEAKGVVTKPHQLHLCYILTPTRYLWSHPDEYVQPGLIELIKKPIFTYLRWWDKAAALRPDVYIPISNLVAQRCSQYYGRETRDALYPPVEQPIASSEKLALPDELSGKQIEAGYYLVVARLVGYKKVDLAVRACAQLDRALVIIGDGPEYSRISSLISSLKNQTKIQLIRSVQSSDLAAYYKNCFAFLAPGEEDFGIAPLEANTYGKPCVLHYKSGAAENSKHAVASVHVRESSLEAVTAGMLQVEKHRWDPKLIAKTALQYNTKHFQKRFLAQVLQEWEAFTSSR